MCVAPVKYTGLTELQHDIDNLKAALQGVKVEEAFLPVAAPSSAIPDRKNEYYRNEEELVVALAEALRTEYRAIVDAGFLLQVDDARAAVTYDRMVPPGKLRRLLPLGRPTRGSAEPCPGGNSRKIACATTSAGAVGRGRTRPTCLCRKIVDLILKVRAGAYLIEAANPRHEHEWRVWKDVKLPDRQDSGSRRGQPRHKRRGASGTCRRTHHALRQSGGPRERHRQHRLRLRAGAIQPSRSSHRSCGQSWRPWPKAPGSPATNFGAGPRPSASTVEARHSRASTRCPTPCPHTTRSATLSMT